MTTIIARQYDDAHWYKADDGAPQYTVTAKDGSDRPTTLRDARKMNLVPSVTTILKIVAKPALDIWKQEQMLLAALTLPKVEGEPESDFIKRVVADSKETAKNAAAKGSAIHESIQKWYEGSAWVDYQESAEGVEKAVNNHFGSTEQLEWRCEKSFAHPLGFGGRLDMYHHREIILDVKTMEFDADKEIKGYDENMMQLAAYREGVGMPTARCANVYVSRSNPALIKIVEWSEEDLQRGWLMFKNMLSYWKLKNKFGE